MEPKLLHAQFLAGFWDKVYNRNYPEYFHRLNSELTVAYILGRDYYISLIEKTTRELNGKTYEELLKDSEELGG